ncbi:MAG: hypothetical protein K2W96_01315 [Gemmataceae bacterium]|nr:hypothetical protein [Gemmataceae bacterium]
MRPLATYRQSNTDQRCRFDLYPDSLRVRGQTFVSTFDSPVPLAPLNPQPHRVWVFDSAFFTGLVSFFLGAIGAGLLLGGVWRSAPEAVWFVTIGVGIAGLVIAFLFCRKMEVAVFLTEAGIPAVAITRAGTQTREFEPFIALLIETIKKAKPSP